MLDAPLRPRRVIHADNLPIVVRILKNHPNALPTPDVPGNTSPHLAASSRLSITQFLIEREGTISGSNNDSDTPLLLAAAVGHDDVVSARVPSSPSRPVFGEDWDGLNRIVTENIGL